MNVLFNLIVVLQVLSALAIIGLGSGASGSLFGASGSSNFLSKSTAVAAAIFFAATLALAYFGTNRPAASVGGGVMERAPAPVTAPANNAGSAVPATVPATVPAAPAGAAAPAATQDVPSAAPAAPAPVAPAPAAPAPTK
jgi:preprotein translocase subunit SecG